MKYTTLFLLLFTSHFVQSQSLPIDFESTITTDDFEDFNGGTATVINNPQSNSDNPSNTVARIIRNGGEIWAGSKIVLDDNLDFTTLNSLSMKVFTTAPVGTTMKFKLEGDGVTERDVQTTTTNAWETLTWDFTGTPTSFNEIVFMFDFGNIGDSSATSTFLFDDIEQLFGGTQIDLPVDFEGNTINYTMSDFGGNSSSLVVDPTDPNNMVIQAIKTTQAATWAGTTIGTPAGFATDIPLTLTDSKMTVRVWSPEVDTPIRLKVEDSDDPTHTCETETNTTVGGQWETLEFDFTNQAPGTESLSVGLSMGWTYNMASIFFNFDTDGATAGEKTYYFDDVQFGPLVVSNQNLADLLPLTIFPNPTTHQWTVYVDDGDIIRIDIFNQNGQQIHVSKPNTRVVNIDASDYASGMYIGKITAGSVVKMVRLIKE